jgi:asparagine synthase (glutamine-hydrolysing)
MAQALEHRGPDQQKYLVLGPQGLVHTRLKIVDLSDLAAQPMHEAGVYLVFNGEIYNHEDLRKDLLARGHTFRSSSDTEVLLRGYLEYGEEVVHRIEGMFAFAILDQRKQQWLLVRDRTGEKPLFFAEMPDGVFAFASEIKALLAARIGIDRDLSFLADFLWLGAVQAPHTLYQHVRTLEPGCLLVRRQGGAIHHRRYWKLRFDERPRSFHESAEELRKTARESVRLRLRADVPVGAFLSGGLDSAAVVGLATRDLNRTIHTYSIGFDGSPETDESADAMASARHLGAIHHPITISPEEAPSPEDLIRCHDGPFSDFSSIPAWLVSRHARRDVTVALTGDGGDELFAGYPRFSSALSLERLTRPFSPLARLGRFLPRGPLRRRLKRVGSSLASRAVHSLSIFSLDLLESIAPGLDHQGASRRALARFPAQGAPLARLLEHNFDVYLPDVLCPKVDRASMAVALECRAPLLAEPILALASGLPPAHVLRVHEGLPGALRSLRVVASGLSWPPGKLLLRHAFRDLFLPELLLRPKRGFGIPITSWLQREPFACAAGVVRDPSSRIFQFLDFSRFQALLSVSSTWQKTIWSWTLLQVEIWLRTGLQELASPLPSRLRGAR